MNSGDKVKIIGYATENQRIFKNSMKNKKCLVLSVPHVGVADICDESFKDYNMEFDVYNLILIEASSNSSSSVLSEDFVTQQDYPIGRISSNEMISLNVKNPNKKVKLLPIPSMISLEVNNK